MERPSELTSQRMKKIRDDAIPTAFEKWKKEAVALMEECAAEGYASVNITYPFVLYNSDQMLDFRAALLDGGMSAEWGHNDVCTDRIERTYHIKVRMF